jgi:hypothetical protein
MVTAPVTARHGGLQRVAACRGLRGLQHYHHNQVLNHFHGTEDTQKLYRFIFLKNDDDATTLRRFDAHESVIIETRRHAMPRKMLACARSQTVRQEGPPDARTDESDGVFRGTS